MSVKMVWFHVVFVSLCVLKEFYVLCAVAEGGNCQLPDHDQCTILPDVCQDASLSHLLCPHLCGFCVCINNIIYDFECGTIPAVCGGPGRGACRRFCQDCYDNTTTIHPAHQTPPQDPCYDRVGNGVACADLPGVCNDPVTSQVMCPKYCGACAPQSTTPAPTTPTPTTPTPTTPAPPCIDNIIYDFHCSVIPHVCDGPGKYACPNWCNLCTDNGATQPPIWNFSSGCYDRVGNGVTCADIPGVCNDATVSQVMCPKYCGLCGPPCINHMIHDVECSAIPSLCAGPGKYACPVLCGLCFDKGDTEPPLTPSQGSCQDRVGNGVTCADLPGVCNDTTASELMCPRFCGICGATTTSGHVTHTTGSQPQSSPPQTTTADVFPDCMDYVGLGKTCDMIPDVCNDIYGRLLCKKHCQLCIPTAGDVTPPPGSTATSGECVDHVVNHPNLTCLRLPNVCTDSLAADFCPKFCNMCGTLSTTPHTTLHQQNTTPHSTATPHTTTPHSTLPHTTHPPVTTDTPSTTHSTTTAATTTTAAPCEDAVGLGMDCGQLQATGFCRDAWSMMVCRKTCNHCPGSNNGSTATTTAGHTVTPSPLCMDHTLNGLTCSAEVCAVASIANNFCARSCGLCSHQCTDHIYNGMRCEDMPSICKDHFAKQLCPMFCGICTATDSPPVIG